MATPLSSTTKTQLVWAYSCYGFIGVFGIAFVVLAGFFPPPSPTVDAEHIAALIRANAGSIRIGMAVGIAASALLLPWGAAVAAQIKRIERGQSMLTYTWVSANAILTLLFIYCCLWWAVAAFRPESSPQVIQSFNDMAWLGFLAIISTALVQCAVLAVATFQDRGPDPVYPRWFGYFQVWCLLLFTPDLFVICFKQGPLAWNGILSFWVVVTAALVWLVVTTHMTARAIKRQPAVAEERELTDRLAAVERALAVRGLT